MTLDSAETPFAKSSLFGDRKGATKKLCDKDFAERFSDAVCLKHSKSLFYWVMTREPLELFRKFFGAVRAVLWLCESFSPPDLSLVPDSFWN